MVTVKVPTLLRSHTGGEAVVEAEGRTIGDVLKDLESRYPGMTQRFTDEDGTLQRHVNIYVNGEDVRYLGNLETEVKEGDVVSVLPAVAGG